MFFTDFLSNEGVEWNMFIAAIIWSGSGRGVRILRDVAPFAVAVPIA